MKVDIRRVSYPLRAPLDARHGSVDRREFVLLALQDEDGPMGWGEAAPLESYDGVSIDDAQAALEDCRALLAGDDGRDREALLAECHELAVLPQAVSAVDLALWDLAGRRAGQPVWQLLGALSAPPVQVNFTVWATDRAGAARQATAAREAGYRCLKVKVGLGDDAGRLAAVRAAAGAGMALRIDANGAWTVAEAQAALRVLEPLDLELCEEPVQGPEAVARLAALTGVPLALDETASVPGSLDRRLCSAAGLKLTRWGGITGLLSAARRARSTGYELYLTSTLDGPLGIAAALHAAAVIAPDRPCGLATLALFENRPDPLPADEGRIAVPAGPGLGTGLRRWYR